MGEPNQSDVQTFDRSITNHLLDNRDARNALMDFVGYPPERFDCWAHGSDQYLKQDEIGEYVDLSEEADKEQDVTGQLSPEQQIAQTREALRKALSPLRVSKEIFARLEQVLDRVRKVIQKASIDMQLEAARELGMKEKRNFKGMAPEEEIKARTENATYTIPGRAGYYPQRSYEDGIKPFVTGEIAQEVHFLVCELLEKGKVDVIEENLVYNGRVATLQDLEEDPSYLAEIAKIEAIANEEFGG